MKNVITVDRSTMSMIEIESAIENVIKQDLGAKKVSVTCKTRNWQGHTCPEFVGIADGLKLMIFADVSEFDLDVDPLNYDMSFFYTLKD